MIPLEPSWSMAFILLILAIFIFALELFLPSAGILFVLGTSCLLGSIYMAYSTGGLWLGTAYLAMVAVAGSLLVRIGFRLWKHSPIGKLMFLDPNADNDVLEEEEFAAGTGLLQSNQSLVGQTGKTLTALRPVGIAEIGGRRLETTAETVYVERDQPIKVVRVDGNRIIVRLIENRPQSSLVDIPNLENL